MWTTPELAPPLLTTTPHQREDVSALDRFNVHRCPTRRVFSEGYGFQMRNDDEIVTSVQVESDPVDDETDEDEDNNSNESTKSPSNTNAFSVLETTME
ncbi:hypothetical protein TNCV_536181 [Trichonephila clavipes]|nr:hypothetical protein TNCV_536181 [Trichonephila clavipes]